MFLILPLLMQAKASSFFGNVEDPLTDPGTHNLCRVRNPFDWTARWLGGAFDHPNGGHPWFGDAVLCTSSY
jgi:hypothetical protein